MASVTTAAFDIDDSGNIQAYIKIWWPDEYNIQGSMNRVTS